MVSFVLVVCVGLSVSVLPADCGGGSEVFEATSEWKEIKEGQKIPAGLHYRMNLQTGKKEAKLLDDKELDSSTETGAVMVDSDSSQPEPPKFSMDRLNQLRKDMNSIRLNRDADQMKFLIATYGNSSLDDKRTILDELEFFVHQIDNGIDFIVLDGFTQVVLPALNSAVPDLVEGAAILIGSASQSNSKVQTFARESGLVKLVLDLCDEWSNKSHTVTSRLIFALSSLIRGNEDNLQYFIDHKGQRLLLQILERSEKNQMNLKVLVLGADTIPGESVDPRWCDKLLSDSILNVSDLDGIEKIVYCLQQFKSACSFQLEANVHLKPWLQKGVELLKQAQDDESDFENTLLGIYQLVQFLDSKKIEL